MTIEVDVTDCKTVEESSKKVLNYIKEYLIEIIKEIEKECVCPTLDIVCDNKKVVKTALGALRIKVARDNNLIKSDDYKLLLNYMIKCNLIENNNQELYLAELGERLVNNYDFYAVFYTEKDYEVVSNNKIIGSIQKKLPIGSIFNLAGSTWEVININQKTRSLTVKEVKRLYSLFHISFIVYVAKLRLTFSLTSRFNNWSEAIICSLL